MLRNYLTIASRNLVSHKLPQVNLHSNIQVCKLPELTTAIWMIPAYQV